MKKEKSSDHLSFLRDCQAYQLVAIGEVPPFIKSLDLNSLQQNWRIGRIFFEMEKVSNGLDALNCLEYILYIKELDYLYSIFKSANKLNCPLEMQKLQTVMIFKERYNSLIMLMKEWEIRQQTADFLKWNNMEQFMDDKRQDNNLLSINGGNMFLAGEPLYSTGKIAKSIVLKGLGRRDTIIIITIMLYLRIGFLRHPSSINQFVNWVMDPTMDSIGPAMVVGCMTTEFKYVIEKFKLFNKGINNAMVGREGLFVSHLGKPITASYMSSTTFENIHSRHAIDYIFSIFI